MRFIMKPNGFEAIQWRGVMTQEIRDFLELRNETIPAMLNPPRIGQTVVYVFDGKDKWDRLYLWEERARSYKIVNVGDWICREIMPYGLYVMSDSYLKLVADPM